MSNKQKRTKSESASTVTTPKPKSTKKKGRPIRRMIGLIGLPITILIGWQEMQTPGIVEQGMGFSIDMKTALMIGVPILIVSLKGGVS